jgi:hypothetical protein
MRSGFIKSKRLPVSFAAFLGGGALMSCFGRASARMIVAAVVLGAGIAGAQAAGALAVGTCGAYGFAYDYRQPDAARTAALGKCKGAGCKIVTAVEGGCAAFAIDGRNVCGPNGYASSARLALAQNTALHQCYRYGGKDCVIRAWVCDAKG